MEWMAKTGNEPAQPLTMPCNVRTTYCVAVDAESLAAVHKNPQPPPGEAGDDVVVNIINAFPEEDDDDPEAGDWIRIAASLLAPRAYAILQDHDWKDNYLAPPRVVNL